MQVEGQHGLSLLSLMATGARVSNAYPTCPYPGHNLAKASLIPDVSCDGIRSGWKIFRIWMGMRPISLTAGWRPTVATIGRGSERKVPHIGTETRSKLLREAAVRNIGQWTQVWTSQVACRMTALWVVNCFYAGIKCGTCPILQVPHE